MPRTLSDLMDWQRAHGITEGIITGFWPYGLDALGRLHFDLEAEHLEGWVRRSPEGSKIVFDLDHPESRARVEGAEVVVSRG